MDIFLYAFAFLAIVAASALIAASTLPENAKESVDSSKKLCAFLTSALGLCAVFAILLSVADSTYLRSDQRSADLVADSWKGDSKFLGSGLVENPGAKRESGRSENLGESHPTAQPTQVPDEELAYHCAVFGCDQVVGEYVVTRAAGLPVNQKEERSSPIIATLRENTKIQVVEFAKNEDDERVRARIQDPAGWISTWSKDKTTAFVVKQSVKPATIRLRHSLELCLDSADGKLQNGAKIIVSEHCSQKQFEIRSSDNSIRVKSNLDSCLTAENAKDGGMKDGSDIIVQPCTNSRNQQFILKSDDHTIRPTGPDDLCFSIFNGHLIAGARVTLWNCGGIARNGEFTVDTRQ